MSFTAVRNLTVVSFFVIGGILLCGSLNAEPAPYSVLQFSSVTNIWGTTFDDKPGNYNKGMYFTGAPGDGNRDYGIMPQEDTNTISVIDAPFDMARTSWSATNVDIPTQTPLFQAYNPSNCSPATFPGVIYAMNDTDHIYLALELEAEGINSADRLFLYFDPDNISPVPEFVEGSGYCVGVQLGGVTFNPGVGNTVTTATDSCNGHWMDWDNSGSIDTWEAGFAWPFIGAFNDQTYPVNTSDKDDLTIVPRNASEWGDSGTAIPLAGAYYAGPTFANGSGFAPQVKPDCLMVQFKIPLEHLGCSIALGSTVGFAIKWFDDFDGDGVEDCSMEYAWWPTDIERSGVPNAGWEKNDAAFMGSMILNSQNQGTRLWAPWFDLTTDRTTYLVLKNPFGEILKTKVKFYESKHGDATERWAPLPGAGELLLTSLCLEIEPHGVATLQLETLIELAGKKGIAEITNIRLAGYVVAYIGLDSGALQRYAWSVDLENTPFTPTEWNTLTGDTVTGERLINKWYIVGEPGWDFNTSVIIVNPSPSNSAKASMVLYPAIYWDPEIPSTPNLCADIGFHPDFDDDYAGTSPCGDVTGDLGDVINIPPHQAVELRMFELLNFWLAHWNPADLGREITDPANTYWHFRKGTMEIFVQDGDDDLTDTLGEALFGITARESAHQGWAETNQRLYE